MALNKLALSGTAGDAFIRDIPIRKRDPSDPTGKATVPASQADVAAYAAAYPIIRMQVRSTMSPDPLLTASSADGELFFSPNASIGPALSLRISSVKAQAMSGAYDIEFDAPASLGPLTWVGGSFKLTADVTRVSL